MIRVNEQFAITTAIELAKIALANPSTNFEINADTANNIADCIETLENRFTGNDN